MFGEKVFGEKVCGEKVFGKKVRMIYEYEPACVFFTRFNITVIKHTRFVQTALVPIFGSVFVCLSYYATQRIVYE